MNNLVDILGTELTARVESARHGANQRIADDSARDEARRKRHGRGHPEVADMEDAEKRELYQRARLGHGSLGGVWQRFALIEAIGVWLYYYERRDLPPSDGQCRRMWGDCWPQRIDPVPHGGVPLRDVEHDEYDWLDDMPLG